MIKNYHLNIKRHCIPNHFMYINNQFTKLNNKIHETQYYLNRKIPCTTKDSDLPENVQFIREYR